MTEVKTLYDSFNARYLSFAEVADSFIENNYFQSLTENNHSLLMGPRGCGKTTLLKMLTPVALNYWDNKHKTKLLETFPFYGIYIPTDIHWKKQLDQLKNDFGENSFTNQISRITVNINVLVSLIKTLSFLVNSLKNNENFDKIASKEVELSKLLIDSWKLDKPIVPNLDSIELAFLKLVAEVNAEIRKKNFDNEYDFKLDKFLFYDYYDLSLIAFKGIEHIFPEIPKKKWAFCFDELEIAPEWLQFELLENLRSRDQSILLKLTTAPIISLYKEIKEEFPLINASENNDFKVIKIWTSSQKDFRSWAEFCLQLIRSRISRKYDSRIAPTDIFGYSDYERVLSQTFSRFKVSGDKNDFDPGTLSWHLLIELTKIDKTFYSFLKSKGINPSDPSPKNSNQRDVIFRKIKQIAIYRYQFKKDDNIRRSRKIIPLYYGIPLIYEFCDGNPRILIGMIDEFLSIAFKKNSKPELSINEQSRLLNEISTRHISIISSHPDANVTIRDKNVNIKELLEAIGTHFNNKMIDEPFTMDPIGSFKVDEDINNKLIELLELALYLGAIVYIDNDEPLSKNGIIGKRFRLSYTLSPYFGLLSRELASVNLSSLLKRNSKSGNQTSLF